MKKKGAGSRLLAEYWREPIRGFRAKCAELSVFAHVTRALGTKPGAEPSGGIKVSLLCPTRARPKEMARMWRSAVETAANPETVEVVFYLDNDDVAGICGLRLAAAVRAEQVRAVVGGRMILSKCWNAAAEIARGEIFMHCGDDIIFRSRGWDAVVAEKMSAFDDRIAFVYGRDGIQDEKLGTHGFIHREWTRAVGYVVPPLFSSDYNDTWLNEVAERVGRKIYAPEIYTEHMHFAVGKGTKDATYRERLRRHREDGVDEMYQQTEPQRIADAEKLLARIKQCTEREKQ